MGLSSEPLDFGVCSVFAVVSVFSIAVSAISFNSIPDLPRTTSTRCQATTTPENGNLLLLGKSHHWIVSNICVDWFNHLQRHTKNNYQIAFLMFKIWSTTFWTTSRKKLKRFLVHLGKSMQNTGMITAMAETMSEFGSALKYRVTPRKITAPWARQIKENTTSGKRWPMSTSMFAAFGEPNMTGRCSQRTRKNKTCFPAVMDHEEILMFTASCKTHSFPAHPMRNNSPPIRLLPCPSKVWWTACTLTVENPDPLAETIWTWNSLKLPAHTEYPLHLYLNYPPHWAILRARPMRTCEYRFSNSPLRGACVWKHLATRWNFHTFRFWTPIEHAIRQKECFSLIAACFRTFQNQQGGSESHSIHCPTKTVVWDCDIFEGRLEDVPATWTFWFVETFGQAVTLRCFPANFDDFPMNSRRTPDELPLTSRRTPDEFSSNFSQISDPFPIHFRRFQVNFQVIFDVLFRLSNNPDQFPTTIPATSTLTNYKLAYVGWC